MPIIGNLSEFPLPEVLLLIGQRTGRLRILDVPEFGIMTIDMAKGEVQAMRMGNVVLTESVDLVAKLSAIVQAQNGMFEFNLHQVETVHRDRPLMVNQLVMALVCHVDEQIARQAAPDSPHNWYLLVLPQPEIWIEPELHVFLLQARHYLVTGIQCGDLAERLVADFSVVQRNLTNLCLIGLVKIMEAHEIAAVSEVEIEEQIARKSNQFLRAARAASEIKKITSRLQGVQKPFEELR